MSYYYVSWLVGDTLYIFKCEMFEIPRWVFVLFGLLLLEQYGNMYPKATIVILLLAFLVICILRMMKNAKTSNGKPVRGLRLLSLDLGAIAMTVSGFICTLTSYLMYGAVRQGSYFTVDGWQSMVIIVLLVMVAAPVVLTLAAVLVNWVIGKFSQRFGYICGSITYLVGSVLVSYYLLMPGVLFNYSRIAQFRIALSYLLN